MFDIYKEKWFVRVSNEQEAIAVQNWAFTLDLDWDGSTALRKDFEDWDKWGTSSAIGSGHMGGGCLGQAPSHYWERKGHKEIKVTFKTEVDNVTLPVIELSPQQKQIKALEETIATATAQIQKLKEGI